MLADKDEICDGKTRLGKQDAEVNEFATTVSQNRHSELAIITDMRWYFFGRGDLEHHGIGGDAANENHSNGATQNAYVGETGRCGQNADSDEDFEHVKAGLKDAHVALNGSFALLMRCFEVFYSSSRGHVVRIVSIYVKNIPLANCLAIRLHIVQPWNEQLTWLVSRQVPFNQLINPSGKPQAERVLAAHI